MAGSLNASSSNKAYVCGGDVWPVVLRPGRQAPAPAGASAAPSNPPAVGSQTGTPATPDAASPSPSGNAAPASATPLTQLQLVHRRVPRQRLSQLLGQRGAGDSARSRCKRRKRSQCATRGWRQIAWRGQEWQHSFARRHGHCAKYSYRQALLNHNRRHRHVDIEYSAKWPLRDSHPVRSLCAGFAGSRPQRLGHNQLVNFQLILASREARAGATAANCDAARTRWCRARRQTIVRQPGGEREPGDHAERRHRHPGWHAGVSGAALPSIAGNADFSDESVAVNGVAGQVSAFAGIESRRIATSAVEEARVDQAAQDGGRPARRIGPGRALRRSGWRCRRLRQCLRWRRIGGGGGWIWWRMVAEEASAEVAAVVVEAEVVAATSAASIPASLTAR